MSSAPVDGRYRLDQGLWQDADVMVYAGWDLRLNRPVQVKLLQPSRAADPQFLATYREAVSRAAALSHPNLVPVYDSDFDGPQPFVVEAAVTGPSLAARLAAGDRLPASAVLELARALAGALGAAHAAGLAHGSLSPAGIHFDEAGEVRISDFARPLPQQLTAELAPYVAPERNLGGAADARSDMFSLGALLYHVIDGQPPFDGPDTAAINLAKISATPRPLATVAPDLPAGLLRGIEQCLSARPAERVAHGTAFRELLAGTAPPPPPVMDATTSLESTQIMPELARGATLTPPPGPPLRPRPTAYADPMAGRAESGGGVLPWIGLIVVLLVIGGLYYALRNPNWQPPTSGPKVPSVVGQTEKDAQQTLKDAELQAKVVERRNSDTAKGGEVIEQTPPAGEKLPEDKIVRLVVSKGPRFVVVPDVRRLPEDQAKKTLLGTGLGSTVKAAKDPAYENGVVVAQSPPPGQRTDKGASVILYVNKLPKDEPADKGEPAKPADGDSRKGPVDEIVGGAVDAAKQKAGEIAKDAADRAAEKAKDEVEQIKKQGREKLKEWREGVRDKVMGKPGDSGGGR